MVIRKEEEESSASSVFPRYGNAALQRLLIAAGAGCSNDGLGLQVPAIIKKRPLIRVVA